MEVLQMLNKQEKQRGQVQVLCIDDLVPENHLLRMIDAAVDFTFIYDKVAPLYAGEIGRPSVDPVVLFKIVFVQYLFGIRSMRQTIREIEVNMAYRWFLGLDFHDAVPHFTTFGKNYVRRFAKTDIFEQIFARILAEAVRCGFVDASAIFIDATHIKASANKKKAQDVEILLQAKHYQKQLDEEIEADRKAHGKKPLKSRDDKVNCRKAAREDPLGGDDKHPPTKHIKQSTTDPESGVFHKGEHEKMFAYTAHVVCDKNNFVLDCDLSPGNVHDSVMFDGLYGHVTKKFPEIQGVALDAGYKTPWIMKQVFDSGRLPCTPYKAPMTKKGFFKKYEYVYDEYYDCIICPENQVLNYTTTNREGYREFKSDPKVCEHCPCRAQCTESKNHQKVVTLHVWNDYLERAEDIRYSPWGKMIYRRRKETIERVFGDAKEKHGMRYTQYRGRARLRMQVLLTFTCMNLKKLAAWKWKNALLNPVLRSFYCLTRKRDAYALA
jgi:transposase